jgi:hypothetical protein
VNDPPGAYNHEPVLTWSSRLRLFARFIGLPLRRILVFFAIRSADWETTGGVRIAAVVPANIDEKRCVNRIREALILIESVLPHRAIQLRRNVKGVLCFGTGYDAAWGAYIPLFQVCLVDPRFVSAPETLIRDIAATIVHEGTHARLHRLGVNYRGHALERVELICSRAEREFLAREAARTRSSHAS